jgi:hypothetical protein
VWRASGRLTSENDHRPYCQLTAKSRKPAI